MFNEFKKFILRGNVIDLAVGVIIGAAFNKIVDSVVNDLILPFVGMAFNADFSHLYVPLKKGIPADLPLSEAKKLGPVFAWGNFISVVLNFIILAFIVFMIVKAVNALIRKRQEQPAPPPLTTSETLLAEIRDLLKK